MNELTPRQARQQALQTLALAKWLRTAVADTVGPLEKQAKAWLVENDLDPGTRVPARVGDQDVATVSYTNPEEKIAPAVTDETAFGAWLEEQGHTNIWEQRLTEQYRAPGFLTQLLDTLEGELPDGVDVRTTQAAPYITVRQTPKQANALTEAVEALRSLETAVHQITTGEDQS